MQAFSGVSKSPVKGAIPNGPQNDDNIVKSKQI